MAPVTRAGLSAECDEDCADDCRFGQPEEASEERYGVGVYFGQDMDGQVFIARAMMTH